MPKHKKKISFVIPVYNEEEVIPQLTHEVSKFMHLHNDYDFEAIFVENGSEDDSFKLLKQTAKKEKRFKILQLSKNFGCDGGIAAGMQEVEGDACVMMMADLQEPIELVDKFIEKWEKGYEIVYGVVRGRTASKIRNLSSIMFYKIINFLTKNMFPENASDFRLIDKKVYDSINLMKEQNKYLRGLVMWTGFKHTGVLFDRKDRFAGKSKADLITVANVALNGMFSFSYLPLRMVSFLGIGITIFSLIMIIFYLYLFLIHGREAPGVATIILLILILFGILFFVLGIISEYIVRIYDEAKGRPTHIVKSKINFK